MKKNILLASIVLLFIYMILPLLGSIAMGAIFTVLLYPAFLKLRERKISPVLSSAILTISASVLIFMPGTFLIIVGAKAISDKWPVIKQTFATTEGFASWPWVTNIADTMRDWFGIEFSDLITMAQDIASNIGGKLVEGVGQYITHIPAAGLGLLISIITLFFLLIDGHRVIEMIYDMEVLPRKQMANLIKAFSAISKALIIATIVVGCVQSLIFSLVCAIVGVKNIPIIGLAVFIMSFIPLIGSGPLTFTVALYYLFNGSTYQGVTLLIAAIIVSTIDNFIRPMVLKGEANLHPLFAFIGVFGGLQLMGFTGLFVGPIIAGLFAAIFKILLIKAD